VQKNYFLIKQTRLYFYDFMVVENSIYSDIDIRGKVTTMIYPVESII